ncbi:MAG: ATP-binding protein [Oscillospiraceae bacterium]
MLVSLKIKNFLSFDSEEGACLDVRTKNCRGKSNHYIKSNKVNLLRFASIYGANAAGKSNIVSSFEFFKDVVLQNQNKNFWQKYYTKYNRNCKDNVSKPTVAEICIKLGTKLYRYGFEIMLNKSIIVKEWLFQDDTLIFIRDIEKENYQINLDLFKLTDVRNMVEALFNVSKSENKTLFISEMNRAKRSLYKCENEKNLIIYQEVFNWIRDSLVIVRPDQPPRIISNAINPNGDTKAVIRILGQFGFDIESLDFVEIPIDSVFSDIGMPDDLKKDFIDDISQQLSEEDDGGFSIAINGPTGLHFFAKENDKPIVKRLSIVHKNKSSFKVTEESDGTKRLLELIEILINNDKEITYIVDEIDRSLHPKLTKAFIELFLESENLGNTQLLVTTHASILLDQKLLRKDSICFATKVGGNTIIKNLADIPNVRSELDLEEAYFSGRFEALPNINKYL